MVQDQVMMAQVDTANQLNQLLNASGSNTFQMGQIAGTTANGGGIVTFSPTGGGEMVAAKIESARQMADVSTLVGKTVAVSKPSMLAGAGVTNNWLMMQPVQAGATKVAGTSGTLLKLEGTRQAAQASALVGQDFTVVKPMMAGKTTASTLFLQPAGGGDLVALKLANNAPVASSLIGKSVSVGQAPMVAGGNNIGSWLMLKPSAAATAAKSAGGVAAAKVAVTPVAAQAPGAVAAAPIATAPAASGVPAWDGGTVQAKTVAMVKVNADPATTAATAAKAGAALKATPVAGGVGSAKMMTVAATTTTGTGAKAAGGIGLGLGLGVWGTALVGVLGATAAYGYYRSRKIEQELSAEEAAQTEQSVAQA